MGYRLFNKSYCLSLDYDLFIIYFFFCKMLLSGFRKVPLYLSQPVVGWQRDEMFLTGVGLYAITDCCKW